MAFKSERQRKHVMAILRGNRYSPKARKFIEKRMRDFYAGKMYSGPKRSYKVKKLSQAKAIALSEARAKGYKVPKAIRR